MAHDARSDPPSEFGEGTAPGPNQDMTAGEISKAKTQQARSLQESNPVEAGVLETDAADDAPRVVGDGAPETPPGADSNHSTEEDGRELNPIGDSVEDPLQPSVAIAVRGVVNVPAAVFMDSVGGLAHEKEALQSPTTPGGTPLLERIVQLELQMLMLEEKYNQRTLAAELNLPPSPPPTPQTMEKLRTAKSVLRETEEKGTLVERVQMLENRVAEHRRSVEEALSSIQSKLKPHVQDGAAKDHESPSGGELHDTAQESGNTEAQEDGGVGSIVPGEEAEAVVAKEPPSAAPTAKLEEPVQEDVAAQNGTVLASAEPQLTEKERQNATMGPVQESKDSPSFAEKESEYKSAEDVKLPAETPEVQANSKSFTIKEKKKKEKKKEKKDRKDTLGAEEKNKQHFKHLRDRLRRAFSFKEDS